MKLFIKNEDTEELIFIPSFLLVDNFEKLLKKRDKKFVQAMLKYIIEFLILDKKNTEKGFNIDFSKIEKKALKFFDASNYIKGKTIHFHDKGVGYSIDSLQKEEFSDLYRKHTKVKEKSGVITFEHIFKYDFARNVFFQSFQIDFDRSIRKERNKDIEKHLVKNSLFYIEFYEKIIKNNSWFKNYKRKDVVIDWVAENIANLIIHKNENISDYNPDLLLEIFETYFEHQHDSFPVFTLEDFKKLSKKRNIAVGLTKEEKKIEEKHIEESFETNIHKYGLKVLMLYLEINNEKDNVNNNEVVKIFTNTLKSNLSGETEFLEDSQFLFDYKNSIEFLKSEIELFTSENLVYLDSRIHSQEYLIKFYEVLKEVNNVDLEILLPLIGKENTPLSQKIVEDYWLKLIDIVIVKFSEKSHTYQRVLNEVVKNIKFDQLYKDFLNKDSKNHNKKASFFTFYKKNIGPEQYALASKKIIKEFNFKKFDVDKRKYFESLDTDEVLNFILSMNIEKLNECLQSEGLLDNILKIENKYSIPKLIAALQQLNIEVFANYSNLLTSKYFWTAFEYNLKDQDSVTKNIALTTTNYFKQFLITKNGVVWLKSNIGQFWLSLKEAETWKKSKEGIFIQRIVLENQSFFIDTEEVFDSYVEVLQSITGSKIDLSYLINNVPETFNFLLRKNPSSILLIDLDNFDRFQELSNIILNSVDKFLESNNKDINLRSLSILLNNEQLKINKNMALEIEKNFEYFFKHNLVWFTSESFIDYMKSYKSEIMYKELFAKTISGLSEQSKKIAENLIKSNGNKYIDLLIKRESIPFWITGNINFINLIKKSSKQSRAMVNLMGYQYFDNGYRKSALEHKEWFSEFTNLFGFKNKNSLHPNLVLSLNQDCKSQKCRTKKTSNNKEGFRDFYDLFLALATYANKFNQVQRPYRCAYSSLWHKTSDWG